MKHLSVLLLTLLLAGCTAPSIHYQNNTITIENQYDTYALHGNTLYRSQQNLSDIAVKQYVFTDTFNETLVYEYARINTGYKFKYNYPYILRQVFDAREVELLKNKDGLGFFTIILKNKEKLNLIAATGTKKSLTMLYGFSDENFRTIIENKSLSKQKQSTIAPKKKIKSRWNATLIITGVLLEQEKRRPLYH